MGLLSNSLCHDITDMVVGRMQAGVETPAANLLLANGETGLASYLDAQSSDAALQSALLDECGDIDNQVLDDSYDSYLLGQLNNSVWVGLARAIDSYVQSSDGGGYASFAAYLNDQSVNLHPLVAELFRVALGDNGLEYSDSPLTMHPQMVDFAFDRVYVGTQGSLTDDTSDAASTATADVDLFAADDDILAVGSRRKFSRILLELSTVASTDCGINVYYYNGDSWTSLSITDQTTGLSANGGEISWTIPNDWEPHNADMQGTPAVFDDAQEGELYYVVLQRTTNTVATPPIATWLRTTPAAITSGSRLVGIDQPPLAIVQVTGADACTVTNVRSIDTDYYALPGTANNALKLKAITSFGSDVTFTLGYTDASDNSETQAQSTWSSAIAAGDAQNIALSGGDTTLKAIEPSNCTITTSATSGIIAIVANAYARSIKSI